VTRLTFQAWRSLLRELLSVVAYAQCDGRLLSTQGLAGILCSMHPRSGGRKAYPRHRATCCPGRTGCARMVQTRAFSVSRKICWRRRWARALPRKPRSGMCAGHENKLASHFDCQDSGKVFRAPQSWAMGATDLSRCHLQHGRVRRMGV
jgi:hypothetical protein